MRIFAIFCLALLTGCLGSNDKTPAYNYVPKTKEIAANPPPHKANILWHTPHKAISVDFIEEVGGDTVIAGRTSFLTNGFPQYFGYAAYDAISGKQLWEKKRGKYWQSYDLTLSTDIVARAPHLVFRHTRYKQKGAQEFIAVDRRTGKEIWNLELDADERAVTAVESGVIVVSYPAGRIFSHSVVAYSLENGKKLWSRSFADKGVLKEKAPKIEVLGDEIYVQTDEFIRIDPKDGSTMWSAGLEFPELDAQMESDGVNAILFNDRKYQLLDVATGRQKALRSLGQPASFALLTDRRVVLGTGPAPDAPSGHESYELIALDTESGKAAWKYFLPFAVASNILVDEGRLIFATEIRLVGLDLKTGKELFTTGRPVNGTPYDWLAQLVKFQDSFLLFGYPFGFQTLYFQADNGARGRHYRDKGKNGTSVTLQGVELADARILISARNAARMAGLRSPSVNPPTSATIYSDSSSADQAIQRSAEIRSSAHSSSMDRQMAISHAYGSAVIDSSFGRGMALANMMNAAAAVGEAVRFSRELNGAKKTGHEDRNRKNMYLRMYRDGRVIIPGWGKVNDGLLVIDYARERRSWVAVSPDLVNPNGQPDALKNDFQPYDISADGKRVYLSGYGYDPANLDSTENVGNLTIPKVGIMAIDLTQLPSDSFEDGWVKWEPIPLGPPDTECNEDSYRVTFTIEWGQYEVIKDCWDKKLYDVNAPAYDWDGRANPLMLAALRGEERIVNLLIQMGYDPKQKNPVGLTAADFARMGGHPKLAKKLAKMIGK